MFRPDSSYHWMYGRSIFDPTNDTHHRCDSVVTCGTEILVFDFQKCLYTTVLAFEQQLMVVILYELWYQQYLAIHESLILPSCSAGQIDLINADFVRQLQNMLVLSKLERRTALLFSSEVVILLLVLGRHYDLVQQWLHDQQSSC